MLSATEVGNRLRGLTPPEGFVGLWEERAGMLFPERAVAVHLRLAAEAGRKCEPTPRCWDGRGRARTSC
jgi:hypothetical protein